MKQLVKKYKPTFVLNLHEDPDEKMFFLYLEGKNYRQKAEKLVSLVSKDMKFYLILFRYCYVKKYILAKN